MAKLSPPLLDGTIPAFYYEIGLNDKGIVKITIPFSINRAVSKSQIKGLALKIKTIQSSSYLYTAKIVDETLFELENSSWVTLVLHDDDNYPEEKSLLKILRVGQFYKFQLAFIDKQDDIGYYSTVAIGKYTSKPNLQVNNLDSHILNMNEYLYIGYYSQENKDPTERVYSYIFNVYDAQGNLFETSGEQLHNSDNDDVLYESKDEFILTKELEIDATYRIEYVVTTINGLVISSPKYRIMSKLSIDPEINADLVVKLNYENGYVNINLVGIKGEFGEDPVTGAFLLSRACSSDNYGTWDEISRFKLAAQFPSRLLWQDFTVEQGKTYKYSLQQYNDNGLYSNKIFSNAVYVDFEHAFLYDGERQLKIKYNPKITSFKTDVLETKTDTIGSQHPFIFRNGKVYYHEFPISGLISYQMDEENLFYPIDTFADVRKSSESDMQSYEVNLTSKMIANERDFKMEVLKWLTNGKPKVFRSPTEGNFIVRLMNTSLSPNDTVGRMLHTFSSTAYEVAEFNYQNLSAYNFIHLKDPEIPQLRFETINFRDIYKQKLQNGDFDNLNPEEEVMVKINNHPVYTIRFNDMMPNDRIEVQFSNGAEREIRIGATGSYYIDTGVPMSAIFIPMNKKFNSVGSITYSYYSVQQNIFDKVSAVSVIEVPTEQYIGKHDIIQEIEYVQDNIGNWRKNPKIDIIEFFNIYAERRETPQVRQENGKYYKGRTSNIEVTAENADPFAIYEIGLWQNDNEAAHYRPGYSDYRFTPIGYKDFYNNKTYVADQLQPIIVINGSEVSVKDTRTYNWFKPGKIKSLVCGNGVFAQVSYQIRVIDYLIEDDPNWAVKPAKDNYEKAIQELQNHFEKLDNNEISDLDENILRKNIKETYRIYINTLIDEQIKEKEAEGLL